MKIAYLYSRFPVVSQTFCLTEMLALERQGVELSVASLHPPPSELRHGAQAELKAEVCYAPPQRILKLWEEAARAEGRWPVDLVKRHEEVYGAEYKAGLRARNALFFAERFTREGVGHFHVHFANRAAHTAIFLKKISGIPFSITAHAQDFQVQLGSNRALLREMCAEASFVVAVSDYSRQLLAEICPGANIRHVYNGIDLGRFNACREAPGSAVPKMLGVGRLLEMKGFQTLVGACALLKERQVPFTCEIVGEGPLQAALETDIARHGLGGQVRLAGVLSQEEVARRLAGCDVFALPCKEEADGACDVLPTVILEAMAAGKPVVSTPLAAIPEMVGHGESGLLVAPGDVGGLADALAALLRDEALRRRYGEAARRKAEAVFRVEETSARLKALFDEYVRPSGKEAAPAPASACLLDEWPCELFQRRNHGFQRIIACKASHTISVQGAARRMVKEIEFLPERVVLEAEWRQEKELAARISSWRPDLGPSLPPGSYDEQPLHALWLRKAGLRHLHAFGSRALLTAWILRKLCGVTISATLEQPPVLPEECLGVLLKDCVTETKPTLLQRLGFGLRASREPIL